MQRVLPSGSRIFAPLLVLLTAACPATSPEQPVLDSKIVLDGVDVLPVAVAILARPGGGVAAGKALLVDVNLPTEGDEIRRITIELPPLEAGAVHAITPFGAPHISAQLVETQYLAHSGRMEVVEAGARAGDRVRLLFTELAVTDKCGVPFGLSEIIVAGEVEESLPDEIDVPPTLGFIDTVVTLDGTATLFVGPFVGGQSPVQEIPVLTGVSQDSCGFTLAINIDIEIGLSAGTYPLRYPNVDDVWLYILHRPTDKFFDATAGTLDIETAPTLDDDAALFGTLSDVVLAGEDGETGSMSDTTFILKNTPFDGFQ